MKLCFSTSNKFVEQTNSYSYLTVLKSIRLHMGNRERS